MALQKRVKQGGSFYEGYFLAVGSAPGNYPLVITKTNGMAINSVSVTPDAYGMFDTWSLKHYNDAAATGSLIAVIATNINNIGANASISLDLPALELMNPNESLKFNYVNTASLAVNVYLILEVVGLIQTA